MTSLKRIDKKFQERVIFIDEKFICSCGHKETWEEDMLAHITKFHVIIPGKEIVDNPQYW